DLVQDGIDIAFRIGQLEDSSLIRRYLGDVRGMLCASPEYLRRTAAPSHPDELSNHSLITARQWPQWHMAGPDEQEVARQVKARLQVNDFASLYSLTLAGAGIAPLPMLIAAPARSEE